MIDDNYDNGNTVKEVSYSLAIAVLIFHIRPAGLNLRFPTNVFKFEHMVLFQMSSELFPTCCGFDKHMPDPFIIYGCLYYCFKYACNLASASLLVFSITEAP